MSRAQQTIIRVRAGTQLSTEVASLLPSASSEARKAVTQAANRGYHRPGMTFCPICGGPKSLDAARCSKCRNDAQREGKRASGGRSAGRSSAARSLLGEAISRAHPDRKRPIEEDPGFGLRNRGKVRGAGQPRQQPRLSRVYKQTNGTWAPVVEEGEE